MRTDIPTNILTSAHSLEPDGMAVMFVLTLASGPVFRMHPKITTTWQGNTYDFIPCTMTEMQLEADGKANRPSFSFANPQGMFTQQVYNRLLDNAELTRIRLLRDDLINNRNFAMTETMRISQVLNVGRGLITAQLRDAHDGQNFMLPAGAFYPPEFPHVKL